MSYNLTKTERKSFEILTPFSSSHLVKHNSVDLLQPKNSVSLLLPFVSSKISNSATSEGDHATNYTYSSQDDKSSSSLFPEYDHNKSYINKLPFEIRYMIAQNMSQYDAVNLLCVNKAFFCSTIPRIYHTIVIDPTYSSFDQDLYLLDGDVTAFNETTFIKQKSSFKGFLKQLSKDSTWIKGENGLTITYAHFIKEIKVAELPDNFVTPFDLEIFNTISIKKMKNLHKFYWNSEIELPYDFVQRLPNKQNFSSLLLNLDLQKLPHSKAQTFSYENPFNFEQLEKLSIESFLTSKNLFQLFNNFTKSGDKYNTALNRLIILRLARFNSRNHYMKNISSSLLVLTRYIIENEDIDMTEYDLHCISSLMNAIGSNLKYLKMLSFESFIVRSIDAIHLSHMFDLSLLTHLELRNITEVQILNDVGLSLSTDELYRRLDEGFLIRLAPHLVNLKSLFIEYREGLRDTVPSFIDCLQKNNIHGGLRELDVIIRWNVTKLCSLRSWKELCSQYVTAILSHSKTLEKLSLDTKEDSVFSDLHKLISPDILLELKPLDKLVSLRLHGYLIQPFAPSLVFSFPNLKNLELFRSGAGGTPQMGQQVLQGDVMNDWLRVQYVANAINEKNKNIMFIKIDKCLFEVQDQKYVVPRYSNLKRWFDEKVRVCLNKDF